MKLFPAHDLILGNNLFQIENLTCLEQLPIRGAVIFALPLKIQNAPEAPQE